jgi:hypothetical protein
MVARVLSDDRPFLTRDVCMHPFAYIKELPVAELGCHLGPTSGKWVGLSCYSDQNSGIQYRKYVLYPGACRCIRVASPTFATDKTWYGCWPHKTSSCLSSFVLGDHIEFIGVVRFVVVLFVVASADCFPNNLALELGQELD